MQLHFCAQQVLETRFEVVESIELGVQYWVERKNDIRATVVARDAKSCGSGTRGTRHACAAVVPGGPGCITCGPGVLRAGGFRMAIIVCVVYHMGALMYCSRDAGRRISAELGGLMARHTLSGHSYFDTYAFSPPSPHTSAV